MSLHSRRTGGFLPTAAGGWDSAIHACDPHGRGFCHGVVTAAMGIQHSDSGTLNSKAGWVGLSFRILLMVVVGVDRHSPVQTISVIVHQFLPE